MKDFLNDLNPVRLPKVPQALSMKKLEMQQVCNLLHQKLVETCTATLQLKTTNHKLFIESELHEFERMFRTGEGQADWKYLSQRMNLPEAALEEIYKHRADIINGRYQYVTEYNHELFVKYGVMLGMQKYMDYLREYINTPRLYDTYKVYLPSVDDRIDLSEVGRQYVKDCFNELLLDINGLDKCQPIMQAVEIEYFLASNFKYMSDEGPVVRKKFNTGFTSKNHLAHFVYLVMQPLLGRGDCFINYSMVCRLVTENFDGFQNQSLDSVQRAMRLNSKVPAHLLSSIERNKKMLKS